MGMFQMPNAISKSGKQHSKKKGVHVPHIRNSGSFFFQGQKRKRLTYLVFWVENSSNLF